jgi:DNA-binding IclR family transcriptional regulator
VEKATVRGYWRDVVGAEYDSLPQLSLTLAQAQRLWSLDAETCRWVLESFVESGYLVQTGDGRYQRADRLVRSRATRA